jgi:hypothetical protein
MVQIKGKFIHSKGYFQLDKDKDLKTSFLYPEEALYLLETVSYSSNLT